MAEAALVAIGKELAVDAAKALAQLVAARAYDEVNHAWGLKDQLRKLTRKLEYIQAFLEDASNTKHVQKSHLLDLWLKKVKDVSYMSDDVLDEYAIEMFRRKMELKNRCNKFRNLFTLSNPVFFRFRMSQQVNDVLSRFDELESEARSIGLSQVQIATSTVPDIRFDDDLLTLEETRKYGAASASDFIGREDDMNKLLQMLCHSSNDEHDLTTIAIVGMGGLGKTSLAKRLYDDEKISEHFGNKKFWICVSENFNITRLLNEMVESATSIKGDLSNMDAITRKLQTFLEGKKLLLVLDDVWNDNQLSWNSLKTTLQSIGRLLGSVILITTRSEDVAKAAGAISIHKLGGLSPENSWDLFKLKVHLPEAQPNASYLEDIGRRIVTRCRGVPLSLTVIAGVLRLMHSLEAWEEIDKSELWELPQGQGQILPSLLLSFKHLPSPSLKQCFAHCAIFRKDLRIVKQKLVAHWLAQGFLRTPISRTRKMTMEEIGDEYIKVLLNNSLLQEDENYSDSCKMHDLVHDLAVHVSQDVMFIKEGKEQRDNFGYRHLSYFSNGNVSTSDFPTLENFRKLRTIYGAVSSEKWLIHARNLRSLDLSLAGITEVPLAIESLKLLRFLDLSWSPIRMLPDFIGKLYQLHTCSPRLQKDGEATCGLE